MSSYYSIISEVTGLVLLWLLASILTARLRRRLRHQKEGAQPAASLAKDLAAHLSRPVLILLLSLATVEALAMWPLASSWLTTHHNHLVAWQIFWLALAVVALIEGGALAVFGWRGRPFPIPDLLMDIIRGVLVAVIALLVLHVELGIDVGPLLASTALLTAVAGFALQGVLGNLMAGMSLHLVRTLKPGVWVKVDGIEGRIVRTNWRETRIRTRGGHLYIIPNSRIAESPLHNYAEPTPLRRHAVQVGASYSDAPDEVIAAMTAAARAVPDVRTSPAPEAMITEFQDFGINYRLEFWTTELQRHTPIDGAVNRMIWYQFQRRGIEIPFPMSDKLLNDFMAVVYNQRRLPPLDEDVARTVADLLKCDLSTDVLADAEGGSLLAAESLAEVAALVKRLPFTAGETLCAQDEEGETFWIVAQGQLDGTVQQDGRTAAEFTLGAGAVVGEMGALTGLPRSATLTTTTGTELLEFGPDAFRALLAVHPRIPEHLAEFAAARAAKNQAALAQLARERDGDRMIVLEKKGILGRLMGVLGR